jgi:hypothetical protein
VGYPLRSLSRLLLGIACAILLEAAPPTPTFQLQVTPASPTAFQPFTITATSSDVPRPTGTLGLIVDGSPPAATCTDNVSTPPCTLSNGQVVFHFNQGLEASAHSVGLIFTSGDANFSGTILFPEALNPFTVPLTPTTTSLSIVGLTATATVTPVYDGHMAGTVAFKDGGSPIAGCGAVAISNPAPHRATCTLPGSFSTGVHNLTAVYSGDGANFIGSTGTASLPVPALSTWGIVLAVILIASVGLARLKYERLGSRRLES